MRRSRQQGGEPANLGAAEWWGANQTRRGQTGPSKLSKCAKAAPNCAPPVSAIDSERAATRPEVSRRPPSKTGASGLERVFRWFARRVMTPTLARRGPVLDKFDELALGLREPSALRNKTQQHNTHTNKSLACASPSERIAGKKQTSRKTGRLRIFPDREPASERLRQTSPPLVGGTPAGRPAGSEYLQ